MTLSRRRFVSRSATLAAAAVAAVAGATLAEPELAAAACLVTPAVTPETVALSRLSYGPSPSAVSAYRQIPGTAQQRYESWVRQQLSPAQIADSECDQRLLNTRLKIRYGSVSEARPLDLIKDGVTVQQLWATRVAPDNIDWQERMRPLDEVRVATWLRAIYSRRQLFEVLVDFWHNHFNVKANSAREIAATWPHYDRIIRSNALGNFRTFVSSIAQSPAMMYYLDNVSNRVSGGEGGNENYARELFELHTLGSDNYYKFYDDRSQIGTITWGGETFLRGYVDDDVYNASFALTGWTIANGHWDRPTQDDGSFLFDPNWHQGGYKFVLTNSFSDKIEDRANPINEGFEVIDRLTRHPGTARTLCSKLCRRFVRDEPTPALVDRAVEVWMTNRSAPDQIKKVLEVILLSDECRTSFGYKIRRPLEATWAYLRATGANMPSDVAAVGGDTTKGGYWGGLFWNADNSGQRLFGWDTPTGHPDSASYWANTNGMLKRWNMPYGLTQEWGGNVGIDLTGQTPAGATCNQIVDFWIGRMLGFSVATPVRAALVNFLAQGGDPNQPPQPLPREPDWGDAAAVQDRLRALVQLIVATPEFNLR